jgi:ISXO2 transposase-like protein/transposase-like zinc ribbon protein
MGDFIDRFATEAACRDYLVQLRWSDGFSCPRCAGSKGWTLKGRGLVQCAACGHQASVIAGTIFQDTHKPLRLWFQAIWLVTSQKQGASAMSLQQNLGLGSYETAWVWLHKLRAAMVRPDRDRLQGPVEVDEAWIGGVEEGLGGRQMNSKSMVAIAVEARGRGLGRVRMRRIYAADGDNLGTFVSDVVEAGSVIQTDAWPGYASLVARGYQHRPTSVRAQNRGRAAALELLPRVHLVVSLLKRWLVGTHQGAVRPEHLDYYLDEFCFRFNRRRSRRRGLLFQRLLENAVRIDPLTYEAIVERTGKPRHRRPRLASTT